MHMLCTICSDYLNSGDSIFGTICGHLFHHQCLAQWLERSKSCPQCRSKVTEKGMFRLYPTAANESEVDDADLLQCKLDNVQLELRQATTAIKVQEDKIATLSSEIKRQEEVIAKYERQLVSYDSKVKAIREQLTFANIQNQQTQKFKEENEELKKNMQTLTGLQRVLNSTTSDVEIMLQSYSDLRTIATFATALKRALCESESKKLQYRDKFYAIKNQMALNKIAENRVAQLEMEAIQREDTIHTLRDKLKNIKLNAHITVPCDITPQKKDEKVLEKATPGLNDAILDIDSSNASFNTMVKNIEMSDSPYLKLKQSALFSLPVMQLTQPLIQPLIPEDIKNRLLSMKNATKKRLEDQKTTSIFRSKEPMTIDTYIGNTLDKSYDGMGGHSKPDTFPVPKKSPVKSCIPKLSAKHKLKRPNPSGSYDIQTLLKKVRDK